MGKEEYVLPSGYELEGKSYRYRIEKVLGQGSFGITYLATTRVTVDGSLGKLETTLRVAIKEFFMEDLNGRQGSTVTSSGQSNLYENYKRKFAREAESLSRLNHPHIVKVLELFERNNTFYYAMEYCEGGSLDRKIEQEGGLSECQAKEYLIQIGSALSYMHSHRVLHLDLKPSNIMLRSTGEAVLIDFGLSKHYDDHGRPESSTTIGAGTPGYAAMEQSNYREGSGFAATLDVYGLGATLYKMLSGERPPLATDIFNEGFPRQVLEKKGISKGLIAVVEKSMSSAKRDRYQSIREMMSEIEDEGTEIVQAGEDPSAEERTEVEAPPRVGSSSDRTSPGITSEEERKEEKGKGRGKKRYRWIILGFLIVVLVWGGLELFQIPQGYRWVRSQRELAEQGHAEAQYNLGECYYFGRGVSKDYAEAVKWYRQAAEQGNAEAQIRLGDFYRDGQGVSQDSAEAVKWYRQAAEQGNAEAQIRLGDCYHDGQGVSQDSAEAVKWYRQAAEQGRADAQYMLGECYHYGQGVSQDFAEAVKWYRQAAEQGYGPAKDRLATMDTVAFADEGRPAPSASAGGSAQGSKPEQTIPDQDAAFASRGVINGHEWVDLGLSVKWATCNVGADSASEGGEYYAWGEIKSKKYTGEYESATIYGKDISGNPYYDVARAEWGGTWRLPTRAECQELLDKCDWQWEMQDGKTGCKVTGPNGNSIFLPAAGEMDSRLYDVGEVGNYWSSLPLGEEHAYHFWFSSPKFRYVVERYGYIGHSVRPVSD